MGCLCASVVILGLLGAARAEPHADAPEVEPDPLWAAARELGDDAPSAAARLDAVAAFLPAWTRGLTVEPASEALVRDLRDRLIELDLAGMYEALPEAVGEARRVRAVGEWSAADRYDLSLFPADPSSGSAALGAWRSTTWLRPEPADKGRAFALRHASALGLGGVEVRHALGTTRAVLRDVGARAAEPPDPAAALAVGRLWPQLGGPTDVAVLSAFYAAAPQLVTEAARVFEVEGVGTARRAAGAPVLAVDAAVRVRGVKEAGYPSLDRYLRRIGPLLQGRLLFVDREARCVAELTVDTEALRAAVRFTLVDGAVAPTRCDTGAIVPEAITPLTVEALDGIVLVALLEGELRYEGVKVSLADFWLPVTLRATPAGGLSAGLVFRDLPELDVSGSTAWTGWAVKLADQALDLAGHGAVLFEGLAAGPTHRDGSALGLAWGGTSAATLDLDADALVMDNVFVRFAFRVVGGTLSPSDAVVAELRGLLGDLADAFAADAAVGRGAVVP